MVLVSWGLLYIFSAFTYAHYIPRTKKHNVLLPPAMKRVLRQVKVNKQLQIWSVCSLCRCQNSRSYAEKWRSALTIVQQQISRSFHQPLRKVGNICYWCYTFSASAALGSTMMHQLWYTAWAAEYSKNNERELHWYTCFITTENIACYCKRSLRLGI